jgi:hypothetical protein
VQQTLTPPDLCQPLPESLKYYTSCLTLCYPASWHMVID